MITKVTQRWRDRRAIYRRPDEQIKTARFEVAAIPDDTTAKEFVTRHHYSGSYPAARFRFGLYECGALVGVAVFSHPMNNKVLSIFPGKATDSVELGRLVLTDEVPGNGESWFVARCFELLTAAGIIGIISHSDPMPRTTDKGQVTFVGHFGCVYQATNGSYLGRSTAHYQKILPDGKILSARAVSKIRAKDQGWVYSAKLLQQYGADEPDPDDLRGWLARWLPKLTRSQYHPGNYRYAWIFPKRLRHYMPPRLDYPKVTVRVKT